MEIVDVVNVVPASRSNETAQDAEASIAVNPQNPAEIVATAFTPVDAATLNSPLYYSIDGGFTWQLNFDVPIGATNASQTPNDQSVAFAGGSSELFGALLGAGNQNLGVFRTADVTDPALLATFDPRPQIDQPWVEAMKVVGGVDNGKVRLYVGYNDDGKPMATASATVDVCLDALAAAPVFTPVVLNPRPLGAGLRDGYAIRPAAHADGTVYVVYTGWTGGAFGNNVFFDLVVTRDDHWGSGATPFTDLKDPGDNLAGRRVATNVKVDDGANLGQQRLNNDLAIAVDPRNSDVVYVAWADTQDGDYTLRVRRSTNRGVDWSDDLLTVRHGTMAALAINSGGVVGLLYQQVDDNRWVTHFRRTTDGSGTHWSDVVLATAPANVPVKDPNHGVYLGDWARITAVGGTFYGVFCGNNTPDPENFPRGVRFQRKHQDAAPFGLLGTDGVTPVNVSIDPFFFRVRDAKPTSASRPQVGSLLIPSAVALLAHRRLRDLVEALERKSGAGLYDAEAFFASTQATAFSATERRVLGLARTAVKMFEAGGSVDGAGPLDVAHGIGRFAVAGSAAFELPAYAELFTPNGGWVANTIRRGTPDPNRSRVIVPSSQFAVRAGELALTHTRDDVARARIQSFSMGMLSALASQVVVDPVLRGLQARRSKRDWNDGDPALDVAQAEERIVRNVLGGRDGAAAWQGWWPSTGDVPDALFDGYLEALEEAYALTANRPRGFADFEEQFRAALPPGLTRDRLRDAYKLARLDAQLTSWSTGTWYASLLPILVTPVVSFALVRALPRGSAFVDPAVPLNEAAVWEVLTLSTALGAGPPFGYSIYLWTQVSENDEAFAEAMALFGLRLTLAIASIAASGESAGVRWGLLYTPLALTDVYSLIRGLIEKSDGSPAGFVFLLQTIPVLTGGTVLLFSLIAAGLIAAGVDKDVAYVVVLVLLAAIMLVAVGIPLAVALSRSGGLRALLLSDRLRVTESLESLTETGGPEALAALFDDSTLWFPPGGRGTPPPALPDLHFPAGRRALLRVWWTGAGALTIAHDEHTVTFKRADGTTRDVVLPPGKTSAQDLAALLVAQMPGVQAEPYADDVPYDLPYPHALADAGDEQSTLALHDAHAHDFAPVGTSRDGAYLLRHTPRVELATTYSAAAPARSQLEAIGLVPSEALGDVEETAIGMAADLAALLCLGAAPSLVPSTPPDGAAAAEIAGPVAPEPRAAGPALGNLGPVFQVFRQWNLDERRVNEWRQVVAGGAVRDAVDPAHADATIRPDSRGGYVNAAQNAPPAPPTPAPETVARALGWIPLWRAWTRVATDLTADADSTTPMHYTAAAHLADGASVQPSNADLTNGIRFLLDLP